MNLLSSGADAAPEDESDNRSKKRFHLITIGRKKLPELEDSKQSRVFWASISTVGEDLHTLARGLGEKNRYDTKTRGTRHSEASCSVMYKTLLGPTEYQQASTFMLQVKNPLTPNTDNQRVGPPARRFSSCVSIQHAQELITFSSSSISGYESST